jgi:hypothetical protein
VSAGETALSHEIFLPRLKAARNYDVEIRTVSQDGRTGPPWNGTFSTDSLPAELADLRFAVTGTPGSQLFLLEPTITSSGFFGLLIVDGLGDIVWYVPAKGAVFGSTRRANGNFVFVDPVDGLIEVTPDRRVVRTLPTEAAGGHGRIHHAVSATPQNTLYFIANEIRTVSGTAVTGEAIWEWNPESGTIEKRWSAFDFLSWEQDRGTRSLAANWLHGNGLALGTRGNILFSARNADLIVSIAPDFRSLEWKLGGGPGALAVAQGDRFWGQHGMQALADDRLLLFDNGFGRPGTELFSRGLELRIDRAASTAARTWEFRRQPDAFSPMVSSVNRLPNGNTVILFGMTDPRLNHPVELYEVTPSNVVVWRLTAVPAYNRVYRATPLESLAGETVVSPSR